MSKPVLNAVQNWYLKERGITPETLERCRVETTDTEARWQVGKDGPWKVRTGFGLGEKRRFWYEPKGLPLAPWFLPVKAAPIVDPLICTEGETDAKSLWQAGGKDLYGQICALPGCDAITQEAADKIARRAGKAPIYFVLDNETKPGGDYNPEDWKESKSPVRKVDESWKKIQRYLPHAKRIYLPQPYKDICEYLNIYSIQDFDKHVVHAPARYNYESLDLSHDKDLEPSWLWKGGLPHGMFGMIQGNGGLGKSWILMGLAVAIAEGWPTFMGRALDARKGRAMLVDNENPRSVVRYRLKQLGLTEANWPKLRIISHQVMLDEDPEKLFEDVATFDPDFLGLDSLTTLHTLDENKPSQMGVVSTKAIRPLAHDLGVSVFLLHHVNRGTGSAQARTRGGEHVANATDVAWDVSEDGDVRAMERFRTRIGGKGTILYYAINDKPNGKVEIEMAGTGGDVL
jgi:hypothetical protein